MSDLENMSSQELLELLIRQAMHGGKCYLRSMKWIATILKDRNINVQ